MYALANHPASQPISQQASQPTSQSASQTANTRETCEHASKRPYTTLSKRKCIKCVRNTCVLGVYQNNTGDKWLLTYTCVRQTL